MRHARMTGPGAGSDKYDILTALAVAGLAAGGQRQISLLRLMALVTARYNWAQDEVAIGQREMAQMWSVDERTAKREVKRLTEAGLLVILRPGVKGRVAVYRLDLAAVCLATEGVWSSVGPDYADRMTRRHQSPDPEPLPEAAPPKVVQVDFANRQRLSPGDTPWDRARASLANADAARFAAWFAGLALVSDQDGAVVLSAPSRFAATYVTTHLQAPLLAALRMAYGADIRCEVRAQA